MKKTLEVELFGKKLLISERSVRDIIDASNFSRDNSEPEKRLFLNSFVVSCGLKINLDKITDPKNIPAFHLLKRWSAAKEFRAMKSLIATDYIMQKLSLSETSELADKIMELDFGIDAGKKKKADT